MLMQPAKTKVEMERSASPSLTLLSLRQLCEAKKVLDYRLHVMQGRLVGARTTLNGLSLLQC